MCSFFLLFRFFFSFSVAVRVRYHMLWNRKTKCSATEGADSRPASGPGTPTDEKAGQVGMGKWNYWYFLLLLVPNIFFSDANEIQMGISVDWMWFGSWKYWRLKIEKANSEKASMDNWVLWRTFENYAEIVKWKINIGQKLNSFLRIVAKINCRKWKCRLPGIIEIFILVMEKHLVSGAAQTILSTWHMIEGGARE